MIKVQAVTGYVPIPDHPRTAEEYGKLGEKFKEMRYLVAPFYAEPRQLLYKQYLWEASLHPMPATGDNVAKNTLTYHCVQHQKIHWLLGAADICDADVLVWIDYGIFHLPGVTPKVIDDFLDRIKPELAIPGCWPEIKETYPETISWRFCGSVMVCERSKLKPFAQAQMKQVRDTIKKHDIMTWEVNTWADMEANGTMPEHRWYKADHNASLFTEY